MSIFRMLLLLLLSVQLGGSALFAD